MNETQLHRPNGTLPKGQWQLKRQDDHGNQFIMANFSSRKQAENTLEHYERKGHKQTYWIERANRK
ncbi:MAG: hypothetical protein SVM79_10655 [Chloroflexota bacterium]|nr:hypothetical protein [Chloroflexota bacterium]